MGSDLDVLWFSSPDREFETDWIRELFFMSGMGIEIKFIDESYEPSGKPTVLICGFRSEYRKVLRKISLARVPYGVILLSDEHLIEPMECLRDPNCFFYLRNYFKAEVATHPKVGFFGIGYKNGFRDGPSFGDNDGAVWAFMGAMRAGERERCLASFADIGPNRILLTKTFNDPAGMKTEDYKKILGESIFALCPRGPVNAETFRVYEALEAGCIPVVTGTDNYVRAPRIYWELLFAHRNVPFVIGGTWEDCANKVKSLLENPAAIRRKKEECRRFYALLKHEWASQFRRAFATLQEK